MWTTPTTTSSANGRPPLAQSDMPSQPTSAASLASTAPPDGRLNWQEFTYPTALPQRPSNAAPVPETAPPPHRSDRIHVFEYQWGEELILHLLGLPPRSNFGGKFAIIADPGVDNPRRAQIFADQLRSRGVPISETHSAARAEGAIHAQHTLFFSCRCEEQCSGRFLVSVGDDVTHPYGVPGQRIGVALYHPSSG